MVRRIGQDPQSTFHQININLFAHPSHRKSTTEHAQLAIGARQCRILSLAHSKAVEFMKSEGIGDIMTGPKEYYNFLRHRYGDKKDPDSIAELLTSRT
jgi:hypothetical protein